MAATPHDSMLDPMIDAHLFPLEVAGSLDHWDVQTHGSWSARTSYAADAYIIEINDMISRDGLWEFAA